MVGGQHRLAAFRPDSRATVLPAHQKRRFTDNLEMHGSRATGPNKAFQHPPACDRKRGVKLLDRDAE